MPAVRMSRTAAGTGELFAIPELFTNDRLDFCVMALACDPCLRADDRGAGHTLRNDAALVFGILEEDLEECYQMKKKEELARLDDILYKHIGELCALYQMLANVRLHRPYPGRSTIKSIFNFEPPKDGKLWRYLRKGFLDRTLFKIHHSHIREDEQRETNEENRLADLLKRFLDTSKPTGSRYTQKWLDKTKTERTALDNFGEAVGARHERLLCFYKFEESNIKSDLKISQYKDPENLAEIEVEKREVLTEIAGDCGEEES